MNKALRREVLAGLLQTAFLSAFIIASASYIGHKLSPYGTVGLMAVLVLAGHVYRRLRQPAPPTPAAGQDLGFDRPFARFAVIRERLRWGITSPGHFAAALRPMLVELADDRLRRRHGIDRNRQPERARALLGEPLWRLIAEPMGDTGNTGNKRNTGDTGTTKNTSTTGSTGNDFAVPTIATLDALVRRIEEL